MNIDHNNRISLVPSNSDLEESKKSKRDEQEEPPEEFQNLKRMKFTTEEMEPDYSANLLGSEAHLDFISLLNTNSPPLSEDKQRSLLEDLNENPNMFREKQLEREIHTLYEEEVALKNLNITDLELENSRLEQENQFILNSLEEITLNRALIKKDLINRCNAIKTPEEYEDFLNVIDLFQFHKTIWKEIEKEGLIKVFPLTFITNDETTITISYPLSIWKLYSEVFGTAAGSSMTHTPFIENVSGESLKLFFQCLQKNSSENIIDLDHLEEIWTLAQKYMISWLAKDCGIYFENVYKPKKKFAEEVENLKIAARFEDEQSARSSIISLCTLMPSLWENLNKKDGGNNFENSFLKTELKDLEDQFADLKLYLILFNYMDIFADSFSLRSFIRNEISLIQSCLAIKNHWHCPKIEFFLSRDFAKFTEEEAEILTEIIRGANTPITLKLDCLPKKIDLIYFLQHNSLIHELRLIIGCEIWENEEIRLILGLIKENTTLKSLHLTINNYDDGIKFFDRVNNNSHYFWNWPDIHHLTPFEVGKMCAKNQIKDALQHNQTLRKEKGIPDLRCSVIQSNLKINDESTYKPVATIDLSTHSIKPKGAYLISF